MPELPEVQTIVAQLKPALEGERIVGIRVARADVIRLGREGFGDRIRGSVISRISRHGKRIIIGLSPPAELVIHLGMSGRLILASPGEPVERHTHVRLAFEREARELRFRDPRRFGGLWLEDRRREGGEESAGAAAKGRGGGMKSAGATAKPRGGLAKLGPDALAISAKEFGEICGRRRQIKALLLDQAMISGLGNIYCDEALFEAGIHPRRGASSLSAEQVKRLAAAIRRVLRRSLASGGSSLRDYRDAEGAEGAFQTMVRVYGRYGEPCARCGRAIARLDVAGRTTHFCPRCQRA